MTFYQFINSKDIRAYWEKIGYLPSPLEAAWLVYQCRTATLKEKHRAWQEIIDTLPDCTIDWRAWHAPRESLHQFLRDYMALEQKWLRQFNESEGAAYQFEISGTGEGQTWEVKSGCLFSGAAACFEAAKKAGDSLTEPVIHMTKRKIDDANKDSYMALSCRKNGDVLNVILEGNETDAQVDLYWGSFECLWFAFPVPFEKGDILWDPKREEDDLCCGPIAIENTTPAWYAETGHKGYDNTDMNVWGYFQDAEGHIYSESAWNYMNYEYYPPERLTGKRRIMKALGNFMKDKIDIGLFAEAYHHILTDEHAGSCRPTCYTEEGMRLVGLEED